MSSTIDVEDSELSILRRVVEADRPQFSEEAARAILKLRFNAKDRRRVNALAAKNRSGSLSAAEERLFSNYIRVGQTLGILQSKARMALKKGDNPKSRRR